jgi:hypothetical protein
MLIMNLPTRIINSDIGEYAEVILKVTVSHISNSTAPVEETFSTPFGYLEHLHSALDPWVERFNKHGVSFLPSVDLKDNVLHVQFKLFGEYSTRKMILIAREYNKEISV